MKRRRAATTIAAAVMILLMAGTPRAEGPRKPRGTGRAPTAAEVEALKKQLDEQRELIMELTQLEGEHYEFLLKLLQSRTGGGAAISLPRPSSSSSSSPPSPSSPPPPLSPSASLPPEADTSPAQPTRPKPATITGHVQVKGKAWGPIYVYVENVKEAAVDRNVEIVQRDRAFVPSVLVVQKGTRVSFPNADPFLHNVFSPSPAQPFDLGSYRQGEKAGSVKLFTPGIIEVLCNMHAKMRANILVVPNRHYTKVGSDGSFRLENVPSGARQVVAWTPDAKPVTESVTLTPAGANLTFALQVESAPPPLDKMGKVRSTYRQEE